MKNEHALAPDRARRYRSGLAAIAFSVATCAGGALLTASCAGLDDPVVLATPESDASSPPLGSASDAGDSGEAAPALQCLATECPAPYATCGAGGPGTRPPFKCQHNLLTDSENCGACGNACQTYPEFFVYGVCSNGVCEPHCDEGRRDCNGLADDGCETFVPLDPKNCGSCGHECAAGEPCLNGICGCPSGKTACGPFECVDLQTDDNNCGACGKFCEPPEDAGPLPPNMRYACVGGKCNQLICEGTYRNCNGKMEDGCEIDVERDVGNGRVDPDYCGACDEKCAPSEECRRVLGGKLVCRCKPNETLCENPSPECIDLSTNPNHCGLCDHPCPFVDLRRRHQIATCVKGLCGTECEPGWGDCNNNPADGCETNLSYDGANCGACGARCDTGFGQPCVDGRCLTVDCDAGDPVTR